MQDLPEENIEFYTELLKQQRYSEVVSLLTKKDLEKSTASYYALLADAYFHLRKYSLAIDLYEKYLTLEVSDNVQEKLHQCKINKLIAIEQEIQNSKETDVKFSITRLQPDNNHYDFNTEQPRQKAVITKQERFSLFAFLSSCLINSIDKLLNHLAAHMHNRNDDYWTNWYRPQKWLPRSFNLILQLIRLAWRREKLFANNIIYTYPPLAKIGFCKKGYHGPPLWALYARTDDGSWNWLPKNELSENEIGHSDEHDPMVGAALSRFNRNLGDDLGGAAITEKRNPGTTPVNIFEISNKLLRRNTFKEIPFLNLIAMSWIQFMTHDWVSHGDNDQNRIEKVPLPATDFRRSKYHLDYINIPATRLDPSRQQSGEPLCLSYLNEVTHWWDASQIYGSDKHVTRQLRCDESGDVIPDGKLFLTDKRLPNSATLGIELTGFNRNWWLGLSMLHTIFANEHNTICDVLKSSYPDMHSDELFLKARLINAALLAKIHTVEWTPAILPNPTLYHGMHANWYGLLSGLFSSNDHKKTLSTLEVNNRELGGIIGNPRLNKAKFAFSEEFTAVYRMHSLIPDEIDLFTTRNKHDKTSYAVTELRHAAAVKLMDQYDLCDLFYAFGNQHPGALVLNNLPGFMQELSIGGNAIQDLGAIDIYRDRERGVPFYNQLRRELSLKPLESFADIHPDTDITDKLREVYGCNHNGKDNIEDLDLLIGTLAEGYRPTGFGFGETLFEVFILNASWRLLTDRFYTDDYRPEIYTQEGLQWIDNNDIKSVLLRHCPELSHTGLSNVKNAFEPWDETELTLERHPLLNLH